MVRRRIRTRGMTLVELMVTMIISSIVAASTFMFFAGQQRIYETQTKMLNVQQNVWAGMEVLARFMRATGSGMYGCVRPVVRSGTTDLGDDCPVALNGGAIVRTLAQRPQTGLRAYAQDNSMQRIPPLWIVDQVAADATTTGIVLGTDVITVAVGNRSSGTDYDAQLAVPVNSVASSAVVQLPPGESAKLRVGEFIVFVGDQAPGFLNVINDRGCTLLQITGIGANDVLNHLNGPTTAICNVETGCLSNSPWNPNDSPSPSAEDMIPGPTASSGYPNAGGMNGQTGIRNLGELWWVRFAIRWTNNNGDLVDPGSIPEEMLIPALTMERLDDLRNNGPQILAEGIEDLQVAFACDTQSTSTTTSTATSTYIGDGDLPNLNDNTDEWILNAATDTVPTALNNKCNLPTAVRVTLIARSLTQDSGIDGVLTQNRRPAVENHCAATKDPNNCAAEPKWDGYRRRVLTTTVYPRNNN